MSHFKFNGIKDLYFGDPDSTGGGTPLLCPSCYSEFGHVEQIVKVFDTYGDKDHLYKLIIRCENGGHIWSLCLKEHEGNLILFQQRDFLEKE